jgi:predicted nucleotidyltransferase
VASAIINLEKKGLLQPPKWLPTNMHYEVMMGSIAYGVSSDSSDLDVYGFAIPPKDMVFPHLRGEILGFGNQIKRFEQYQQHHIMDPSARGGKGQEYDFSIYSIVKFFQLCMDNNPNMIDCLFVPNNCVLHATQVGQMVRENRRHFLHRGAWHRFKGYAFQQMKKINTKNPEGKRKEMVERFGFDVKYAYHLVRLMLEIEQILTEGDLDLMRNREHLKAIRRGEWTQDQVQDYFTRKEIELETLYNTSELRYGPDETYIKKLLLECLEHHYGSLDGAVVTQEAAEQAIAEIAAVVHKYEKSL